MARWGWCAFVALLFVGRLAEADRIAVAPLRVSSSREIGGTLKEQFRSSVGGGLATSGHDVITDDKVAEILKRSGELGACDTDVCYRKLGELVSADAVLRGAIEVLGSSNYQVRLEIYDVGDRGLITYVEDACTVCTVREANEALSRAAAEVGRRFTARAHATVATKPMVTTSAPVVAAPVTQAPLAAPPQYQPEWTPKAKGLLGAGIAALILGGGGVASGAALIARGDPTTQTYNAQNQVVLDHHGAVGAGIALTSVGAALLVTGSVLTWRGKWTHDHAHR